jgi:hypothetical protein
MRMGGLDVLRECSRRRSGIFAVALAGLLPGAALSQSSDPSGQRASDPGTIGTALPPVDVVAPSPLAGPGIDRDKVPGMIQTVTAEDFARRFSSSITDALSQRVPCYAFPGSHLISPLQSSTASSRCNSMLRS